MGFNVFSSKAFERDFTKDGVPREARAYWSNDGEMTARAAEAFFLDKGGNSALVRPEKPLPAEDYWRHPRGIERVEIVGALERWLDAALAPAQELVARRSLSSRGRAIPKP